MSLPTPSDVHVPVPGDKPKKKPKLYGEIRIEQMKKEKKQTLYCRRDVKNADEIIAWAKAQGFKTTMPAENIHVTVAYSKEEFDISKVEEKQNDVRIVDDGKRSVVPLGDQGAVVLKFESQELTEDHERFKKEGASWDHDGFRPHVTISWQASDVDLTKVEPFKGDIILGPEIFKPIDKNWQSKLVEKGAKMKIEKIDESQRVITGWAMVIEENGTPVVDWQGDIVSEEELIKCARKFMRDYRVSKEMHDGNKIGTVVESLVMTKALQSSLGIDLKKIGWLISVRVENEDVWKRVKSGELAAFSIGGRGKRTPIKKVQ